MTNLTDFRICLLMKIVIAWDKLTKVLSTQYHSRFFKTIPTKLFLDEKDISININRFQDAWNYLKESEFPILPETQTIDKLLGLWDDYHKLEMKLDE